jgi:ADP-ribose pyrophosphatase YjhB (NUDIX family)
MESDEKTQTVIASGIIISNRRLLVLKRLPDAERAPGRWELPSGKVSFGESPLDALVRIVREKTGLSVTAGKLIDSTSFISKLTQNHIIIFYNLADLL